MQLRRVSQERPKDRVCRLLLGNQSQLAHVATLRCRDRQRSGGFEGHFQNASVSNHIASGGEQARNLGQSRHVHGRLQMCATSRQ